MTTDRVKRLELVAALLYGRDEEGGPRHGWITAMAKDLGMRRATVAEAAGSSAENAIFDRRLAGLIKSVIPQRETELAALKELEIDMAKTGIVGLSELQSLMTKYGFEFTPMSEMKLAKKPRTTNTKREEK